MPRSLAAFDLSLPGSWGKKSLLLSLFPLLTVVSGCHPTPPVPPVPVPVVCDADPNWISQPSMPGEVAETETFCDFYQFSWQWFLAQASPDPSGDGPVFMNNRVYSPTGGGDQCADSPITGVAGAVGQLAVRQGKPNNFEDAQADGNALYDQNGNILYYNAFYTQAYCSSTAAGFAPGSMESKVSWVLLPEADPAFYTITGTLPGYESEVTLGLVGMHLAIWTPNHPEMIWVSWEHKANAPLCSGTSAVTGWSLTSDNAAACLAASPTGKSGPPAASCDSFGFNVPATHPTGAAPITSTPINVCRKYAHGNQEGESLNGNGNAANLAAITELNTALIGPEGLITKLPGDNPMSVWSNYEMVGGLWTKGGVDSGPPPVPSLQGPADVNSPQRGSLELSNMTLETFQQGDTSAIPNCFGCHNYKAESPLTVSHIQSKLLPTSTE